MLAEGVCETGEAATGMQGGRGVAQAVVAPQNGGMLMVRVLKQFLQQVGCGLCVGGRRGMCEAMFCQHAPQPNLDGVSAGG